MPLELKGIGGIVQQTEAFEAIHRLPQNRVLIAGKLTANAPINPEVVEGLTTLEEFMRHFGPAIDIDFEREEGTVHTETIRFKNISDFDIKGITPQSNLLNELTMKKEQYQKIIRQLKSNKLLRQALSDKTSKQHFVNALHSLISQLDELE